MESSSTSVSRSTSGRARTSDRDDKGGIKLKIPPHRPTRYKEKFQNLRDRYDLVTAAHEIHQRDFNIATAKMKELQAENDFLLDAVNLAEPDLTRILSPLQQEVDSHVTPPEPRADNSVAGTSHPAHLPLHSTHINGNSNPRHPNGNRHRPIESDEHDFPGDHASFGHSSQVQ